MKFHFKKFKLYPINVGETPHKWMYNKNILRPIFRQYNGLWSIRQLFFAEWCTKNYKIRQLNTARFGNFFSCRIVYLKIVRFGKLPNDVKKINTFRQYFSYLPSSFEECHSTKSTENGGKNDWKNVYLKYFTTKKIVFKKI